VTTLSREQAAAQAGVTGAYLDQLVELDIVTPEAPGRFSAGDVRRAMLARSFEDAGIAPDAMAGAIRDLGSRDRALAASWWLRFALTLGIVLLMTVKPDSL
jgi:hypothetical protein